MTFGNEFLHGGVGENDLPDSPEKAKAFIRAYHDTGRTDIDNDTLDKLIFGNPVTDVEREIFNVKDYDYDTPLSTLYPNEQPWNGTLGLIWTPYDTIRMVVKDLNLTADDTFYDLGAGYGRMPIYAGVTTSASCKGIELVDERADRARQAKQRLNLDNVDIISGNVLNTDFSDGNVFYLYNPFSKRAFKHVFNELQRIAETKPVTIVARAMYPHYVSSLKGFEFQKGLRLPQIKYGDSDIAVFKSISTNTGKNK